MDGGQYAAFVDLMAAMGWTDKSKFIRWRIFSAYRELTTEEKKRLREVATWRAEEAKTLPLR